MSVSCEAVSIHRCDISTPIDIPEKREIPRNRTISNDSSESFTCMRRIEQLTLSHSWSKKTTSENAAMEHAIRCWRHFLDLRVNSQPHQWFRHSLGVHRSSMPWICTHFHCLSSLGISLACSPSPNCIKIGVAFWQPVITPELLRPCVTLHNSIL